MKKLFRLLSLLVLIPSVFLNTHCFGKDIKKIDNGEHSKKSNTKSAQKQVKPLEYKIKKLSDNETKVTIVMHIPHQKKDKNNVEKVEFLNPQGKKMSRLGKKVSTVDIDGKSYLKVEFSYTLKIKNQTENDFVWPVPGFNIITSDFDDSQDRKHTHGAIDISGSKIYGSDVVASNSGKVTIANKDGWGGGYGKHVVIDHGNGRTTLYGHLSDVTVKVGDEVITGQKIGEVGNTGFSTGAHLHFEYKVNGVRTDPANILDL